jgi:Na+/alanine symporter
MKMVQSKHQVLVVSIGLHLLKVLLVLIAYTSIHQVYLHSTTTIKHIDFQFVASRTLQQSLIVVGLHYTKGLEVLEYSEIHHSDLYQLVEMELLGLQYKTKIYEPQLCLINEIL